MQIFNKSDINPHPTKFRPYQMDNSDNSQSRFMQNNVQISVRTITTMVNVCLSKGPKLFVSCHVMIQHFHLHFFAQQIVSSSFFILFFCFIHKALLVLSALLCSDINPNLITPVLR